MRAGPPATTTGRPRLACPLASTFRLCGSGCQNRVRLTCASLSATTYTSVLISRPSGVAFCKIHRSTQREPGPKPARSHRKEPIQETLMTYQRDPDRPIQPQRDRDPLDPPLPMDQPLADRSIDGNVSTGSPMVGIFGAIAVLALLLLGIFAFRGSSPTDPSRTAAQERAMPSPTTTAPSTNVPK